MPLKFFHSLDRSLRDKLEGQANRKDNLSMNEIATPENLVMLRDYKEGFEVRQPNH